MLSRDELVMGRYGSTYSKYPALSAVYTFETGKRYEAYIGMVYGGTGDRPPLIGLLL